MNRRVFGFNKPEFRESENGPDVKVKQSLIFPKGGGG
jgi:hypothetical protein